ncbi:helix-turn-helix transcriptional regulator [Streptomyces griseoluteus]|uniref:helix-turn-helix transcriptional regulator n=1 Tax=Streptomyces griseoluteus TaxID=29306 RepID=UPI0036FDDA2F
MSDITAPEVRFLMNFLEAIERSSDDLGGSALAQKMALDAGAVLFSRMLSGRSGAEMWDHQNAVLVAAKNAIERNLDRHDLSPTLVAQMVGVSPRTLHRSFSESDESLMAFVRRRRLEKAHSELVKLGRQSSVSEIAARWHFADASHFIRNFRSLYGTTPAAYLRSLGGRQQMEP